MLAAHYIPNLKSVFNSYSKLQAYSIGLHSNTFADRKRSINAIRLPEWIKIGVDFEIIPGLVTKVTFLNVYNTTGIDTKGLLSFPFRISIPSSDLNIIFSMQW